MARNNISKNGMRDSRHWLPLLPKNRKKAKNIQKNQPRVQLYSLPCFGANRQRFIRGSGTSNGDYCWFHLGPVIYQVRAFGGSIKQVPCSQHLGHTQSEKGKNKISKYLKINQFVIDKCLIGLF